jgi:radical SAM protein (TIGR01212 family)
MALSDVVNTFGQDLLRRYGERVHKLAINAGFTCPNRDGSKGRGGCTFCNNVSFNPTARKAPGVAEQIEAGRRVLARRTGARRFIAYFQAYTNTYADVEYLERLYQQALDEPDVIGISVGTRPDCVPDRVLDLLVDIQSRGYEVWLELGLQSASERSLQLVNRGHGFAEYRHTLRAARQLGIPVCTHLIVGMPGEGRDDSMRSLELVLALGVDGLKLHPLHVVKGTQLANQWRRGEYQPLSMDAYIQTAVDMIERTPSGVLYHRVTGTASAEILLSPMWCSKKWAVLNGVEAELVRRGSRQGIRSEE